MVSLKVSVHVNFVRTGLKWLTGQWLGGRATGGSAPHDEFLSEAAVAAKAADSDGVPQGR
jgi:hypothetical protein